VKQSSRSRCWCYLTQGGIFLRYTPLARPAITSPVPGTAGQGGGHRRGRTPARLPEATEESLMPASWRILSRHWVSRVSFPDPGLAVPGQVPQLADRFRRHERGFDEPVGDQLGDPRGVCHIFLTARTVAQVPGVEHMKAGRPRSFTKWSLRYALKAAVPCARSPTSRCLSYGLAWRQTPTSTGNPHLQVSPDPRGPQCPNRCYRRLMSKGPVTSPIH
jgi:hypothetical protein